jgi:hypothetical protein
LCRLIAGCQPLDDLNGLHHGNGAEKMEPQNLVGPLGDRRQFRNGYGRRIAGNQGLRTCRLIQLLKYLPFELQVFEYGFDQKIRFSTFGKVRYGLNPLHDGGAVLGNFTFFEKLVERPFHVFRSPFKRFRIDVVEQDLNPA